MRKNFILAVLFVVLAVPTFGQNRRGERNRPVSIDPCRDYELLRDQYYFIRGQQPSWQERGIRAVAYPAGTGAGSYAIFSRPGGRNNKRITAGGAAAGFVGWLLEDHFAGRADRSELESIRREMQFALEDCRTTERATTVVKEATDRRDEELRSLREENDRLRRERDQRPVPPTERGIGDERGPHPEPAPSTRASKKYYNGFSENELVVHIDDRQFLLRPNQERNLPAGREVWAEVQLIDTDNGDRPYRLMLWPGHGMDCNGSSCEFFNPDPQ